MRPIAIEEIPTRFMRRYVWILATLIFAPAVLVAVIIDLFYVGWRRVLEDLREEGRWFYVAFRDGWRQ